MVKPLIHKKYLLEKFEVQGSWIFARIPDLDQDKTNPLNWKKVRGFIDGYEIRKFHLMPMGDGSLFLPVNATIRKKIKKEVSDYVEVALYPDNDPLEIPEEMEMCLLDEPKAYKFFKSISESEQKFYIQWVYSAKREETKIERLARTIDKLSKGLKLHQKKN